MNVSQIITFFNEFYDNFNEEKAIKLLKDLDLDINLKINKNIFEFFTNKCLKKLLTNFKFDI